MAEKVVSVRLQARVEGFTAGMRKAKASVDELTKADVPKAAKGYKDLADKAALAGVAIAAGLGVAIKRFADFDKAMSAVRANTGATGDELESLRAAAIKLGADSQFSAKEAAEGVNELAKAGVASADILGGGLKGSLDLAAAGQIGVAQAAETTATALTQFKLAGSDATHVADLLANGANKAQGGVGDLGAALSQAGLVAAGMGLSVEETTAGLTAFASAGLIGSDAGTSFKTMIQRLQAPVGDAAAMLKKYNISAYDAQGNFVGLANVAGQLQDRFKDLSPEVRNNAMAVIFGSDAVRASTILYNEGADGIRKWTDEVSKTGAASRMAADLTDNLSGDIERLGGAFDSVLIQTGSGANDSLRTLVQGLQGLVEIVGKVPGPVLLAGGGLAALALGVPKGISAFRNYQATLDSVGLSFEKIAARGPRAAKSIDLTTKAAKGLSVVAVALAAGGVLDKIFGPDGERPGPQILTRDLLAADDAVSAFSAHMKDYADQQSNWWSSIQVTNYGDAIHDVFNPSTAQQIDNAAGSLLAMVGAGNNSDIAAGTAALKDLDGVLSGLVSGGNVDEAARLFDQFAAAAKAQGIPVDDLLTKLPGYADLLAGVNNSATLAAGSSGDLADATTDVGKEAKTAEEALSDLKNAIDGLGSAAAQQRAAERAFQSAIDDASQSVKENGKTLDVHSEKGRANAAALDAIAQAAKDKTIADYEATGSTDKATAAMKKGRDAFIDAAVQAGKTKKEAGLLADKLGLIPGDVKILVSESGAEAAGAAIDNAARPRTAVITVKERKANAAADREDRANQQDFGNVRRASGGAIYGAGTGTSDSIPALLSNGEHVLTAAEVSKLGGQSAVYALRKAVQSGWRPAFANGGAVQYAPTVQYMPAGPTSYSTRNDYGLTADQVTIVTPDPNAFRREIRTAPYRAKARPGR